ncbi:MAG TPA: serine protease [Puia sp.]|jgi:tetratricopeptide (TPR) repeat protein|nr:serine protease [Puia sp.]
MPFNIATFKPDLTAALNRFDKEAATGYCNHLIEALYDPNAQVPPDTLEYTLQALRNKRLFPLMQKLGDCFIQLDLQTYRIRRQYAQALIDQGIYAAALAILEKIAAESRRDTSPSAVAENAEAIGLIGRIYKQQYVNADRPADPRIAALMQKAIRHYQQAYVRDPVKYLWHGINLVALIARAKADHLQLGELPDEKAIAGQILERVQDTDITQSTTAYDLATAIEACIARDQREDALRWTVRYINSSADAFEIGSTLRQFKEVWRLEMSSGVGHDILPLLNAALLRHEGGSLTISTTELAQLQKPDEQYKATLQANFGNNTLMTYEWLVKGMKACSAVARIGENNIVGVGSGFLLDGKLISPALGDQIVLLTNAHVISDNPRANNWSLTPQRSVATLETVDKTVELKFAGIYCCSSINNLDTTILTFDADSQAELQRHRGGICSYPIAGQPPAGDSKQRVYIIGHPLGGILRISLQDNIFLDSDDRLMQYRTPTEHGSSGSPVFNENWELIGIHHAGGDNLPLLNRPGCTGKVNEGILMSAILKNCPGTPTRTAAEAPAPGHP